MLNTLFWIALATGLWNAPRADLQKIVDMNNGAYVNDIGTGKWCDQIRLVAAHNYKRLWRKIWLLSTGDVVIFEWCKYVVKTYSFEHIKTSRIQLAIQPWVLWLQTCANDSGTYALIFKLESMWPVKQ